MSQAIFDVREHHRQTVKMSSGAAIPTLNLPLKSSQSSHQIEIMENQSPLIFISYTNADQQRVIPFFDSLEENGFNVWLDCRKLKPGQNWDFEIKRAFDKSSLVIAFLSETSVGRRGYVQRELQSALDKLSEKLIDDIYIIPIILDETLPIPSQLKGIQCINANSPDCLQKVEDALTYQLNRLGLEVQRIQRQEELSWSFQSIQEKWDGLPGYEIDLQIVNFHSKKYPKINEVGDFIKGELLKSIFSARENKLNQLPELYNYAQEKFRRTNTLDAHCSEPSIAGNILTIQYAIHWYNAGMTHGQINFTTYSFMLEPLYLITALECLFKYPNEALLAIQAYVRKLLKETTINQDDEKVYALDPEWVDTGTSGWSCFRSFIPKKDGIEFLFAPYTVSAYAYGPQFATIPYEEIFEYMQEEYKCALGIEHLANQKINKK